MNKPLLLVVLFLIASSVALQADSFQIGPAYAASLTGSSSATTYLSPTLGSLLGDPSADPAPYGTLQYNGSGLFEVDLSGLGDESCDSSCSLTFLYNSSTSSTNTTQAYEVIVDPGLPGQTQNDQSFSISTPGTFGINVGTFGTSVTFQFLDPSFNSTNFLSATFTGNVTIPTVDSSGNQVMDNGNPVTQSESVSASLYTVPSSVPEPSSIALLGTGLIFVVTRFCKKT